MNHSLGPRDLVIRCFLMIEFCVHDFYAIIIKILTCCCDLWSTQCSSLPPQVIELRNYGDNYVCRMMTTICCSYKKVILEGLFLSLHPGVITRAVYRSVLANNLNSDIMYLQTLENLCLQCKKLVRKFYYIVISSYWKGLPTYYLPCLGNKIEICWIIVT